MKFATDDLEATGKAGIDGVRGIYEDYPGRHEGWRCDWSPHMGFKSLKAPDIGRTIVSY